MKKILWGTSLALLAGCFSTTTPLAPTAWTVEYAADAAAASAPRATPEGASLGSVRVAQVVVRAPYDVREIAVLRPNGSLAFDPYNQFASLPSSLLKGAVQDALQAFGDVRAAVSSSSRLDADLTAETTVTRLVLDCREEGTRRATVELTILLLKGRVAFATVSGVGIADAADGNYARAFSAAFSQAMADALRTL